MLDVTAGIDLQGGPCAVIDRAALRHNLGVVRRLAPHSKVLAVVKANAYGHGLVPAAQALLAADAFGVARLSEAEALREAGIGQPIVLLEGVVSHHDLALAARLHLQIVVHSFAQLQVLTDWQSTQRLSVWCKVDTGMNRLGFRAEEFAEAWSRLQRCPQVSELRVMTHLASADERDAAMTAQQLQCFTALTQGLNVERSIGNSAGIIAWPDTHVEWVRPGLMLYGLSPFNEPGTLDLRSAMTLIAPLIAVREVRTGESVGYGASWRAPADTRVGIAAVGYGDGYPRHARIGTPVWVAGQSCPLVGRVSMDMIAIDLGAASQVNAGAVVRLWGVGLPTEQVARYAETIPYELVCAISQRVTMRYV